MPFDAARAKVWVGGTHVYTEGVPHPQNEADAHRHLMQDTLVVLATEFGRTPDTGNGDGRASTNERVTPLETIVRFSLT